MTSSAAAAAAPAAPGREAWVEFASSTGTGLVGLVLSVRKGVGAAKPADALPRLTGFVTVSPDGQALPDIFPWVDQANGEEQRMFIFPMHPETGGNQYIERLCFYNDGQDADCAKVEVATTNDVDPSVRLFYHYRTSFAAVAKPFCMGGGRLPQASACSQQQQQQQQPALILQRMTFHVNLPSSGGGDPRATLLPFRKGIDVVMGPMPETFPEILNREAVDRARIEPEPPLPEQAAQQQMFSPDNAGSSGGVGLVNPFAVQRPQAAGAKEKSVTIHPTPTEVVIVAATSSSSSSTTTSGSSSTTTTETSTAMVAAIEQYAAAPSADEVAMSPSNGFLVPPSAWSCTHWMGICILLGAMMFFGWLGYAITEHHRGLRSRGRLTTTSRSAVGFAPSAISSNPLLGTGGLSRRLTLQSALAED
jgi:hypothetical protein